MRFVSTWTDGKEKPLPVAFGATIAGMYLWFRYANNRTAVLMLLAAMCQTVCLQQYFHICLITGMRVGLSYYARFVLNNTASLRFDNRDLSKVVEIIEQEQTSNSRR